MFFLTPVGAKHDRSRFLLFSDNLYTVMLRPNPVGAKHDRSRFLLFSDNLYTVMLRPLIPRRILSLDSVAKIVQAFSRSPYEYQTFGNSLDRQFAGRFL